MQGFERLLFRGNSPSWDSPGLGPSMPVPIRSMHTVRKVFHIIPL